MRNIDILVGLEREINKFDSQLDKPSTDESLFWLNRLFASSLSLDLIAILFTELRMNKMKSVEKILLSYMNRRFMNHKI